MKTLSVMSWISVFCSLLAGCQLGASERATPVTEAERSGTLVIVGGGLRDSTEPVFRRFVDAATIDDTLRIGIFPTASGKPAKYADAFREALVRYGVEPGQIVVIPLAVKDDSTTPEFDESEWAGNATSDAVVSMVDTLTGAWFVGGDQTRITSSLLAEDGTRTPVLRALDRLLDRGGVIGGTSAGAAMQSELMIASGSSREALFSGVTDTYSGMSEQEDGPVGIQPGLGFFTSGIIDQHFDRKARLGRLIVALLAERDRVALGFGVDEDTALVWDRTNQSGEVVGEGSVVVVDVSHAKLREPVPSLHVEDIRLHVLGPGDRFDAVHKQVHPAEGKSATVGHEFLEIASPRADGPFASYSTIRELMTYLLIDNSAADSVPAWLWSADGRGYRFLFSQTPDTQGFWSYADGTADNYTAVNVRLDIEPIQVTVEPR